MTVNLLDYDVKEVIGSLLPSLECEEIILGSAS